MWSTRAAAFGGVKVMNCELSKETIIFKAKVRVCVCDQMTGSPNLNMILEEQKVGRKKKKP